MNGTGIKGGAFGFRVSSINKVSRRLIFSLRTPVSDYLLSQLVDTKSVNNTTLLHFLERTVAKHFPDMEEFVEELSAPAEAYRGMFLPWILLTRLMDLFQSISRTSGKASRSSETGSGRFARNSTSISLRLSRMTGTPSRCGASWERRLGRWKILTMM